MQLICLQLGHGVISTQPTAGRTAFHVVTLGFTDSDDTATRNIRIDGISQLKFAALRISGQCTRQLENLFIENVKA